MNTPRPTEQIARETLSGLLFQVDELTCAANDGNDLPWQMAEDKLLEALTVVRCVQSAIHARSLAPSITNAIHPALLPLMAAFRPVSA